MNLSQRSKFSLIQFLRLFGHDNASLLLRKYKISIASYQRSNHKAMRDAVLKAKNSQLGSLIQELAKTRDSMRYEISPRYRFDERWNDLFRCLKLDGYAQLQRKEADHQWGIPAKFDDFFSPIEPIIEGAEPVEDDLTKELKHSGLTESKEILQVLDNSAKSFREGDFIGCLSNARVALETSARSITRKYPRPDQFNEEKWGEVIFQLKKSSLITKQEEEGLTGVYTFISPGAHTPIGFREEEFARLGRSLAVSFCFFLMKKFNADKPDSLKIEVHGG